jgi:hypothetical protein
VPLSTTAKIKTQALPISEPGNRCATLTQRAAVGGTGEAGDGGGGWDRGGSNFMAIEQGNGVRGGVREM